MVVVATVWATRVAVEAGCMERVVLAAVGPPVAVLEVVVLEAAAAEEEATVERRRCNT